PRPRAATLAPMLPTLEGELVTLRTPRSGDAEALARVIAEPEVLPWWGPHDAEAVQRDQFEAETGWVIEAGGEPCGWIEFYEEREPRYMHASLDLYVTASLHGRGHGIEAMRLAIRHLVARGHHRFTIDPALDNGRSIAAYAKLGFQPVGKLRSYERDNDGEWRDGLLMDLLADELTG
ncbi:MAG: GNAT family protein, partial [Thermoleophilaceae bacterium]